MIVQIYAFTNIDQAIKAAALGVSHIGFVAGRYGQVHGELSFDEAARLVDALPAPAKSSALTMATDLDEILRMARHVEPDIVHISTDTWDVGPAECAALQEELPPGTALMKSIDVGGPDSLEAAAAFHDSVQYLLLDTKVEGMPGVGATGRTHDWSLSRKIVEDSPVPVILAGGLTPENVREAIKKVQPDGVDSNTGTNLPEDPVQKDMDLVKEFTEAALRTLGSTH